jgi:hypothetical protein
MTDGLSASDVALLQGDKNGNNYGGFGGDGAWMIVLFLIFAFFGFGRNGNGLFGNGNGSGSATDGYILTSDFANIERKIDSVNTGMCDGFYTQAQLINGVNTNILTQGNANNVAMMQGFNGLQTQIADCCCQNRYDALQNANATNNAIQSGFCQTNYNNSNNTRDIIESQNAGTRAILEVIQANKVEALNQRIAEQNQQINSLQFAASQSAQNQYLIDQLMPNARPTYLVPNPHCCTGQVYNGYFNNGTTIA